MKRMEHFRTHYYEASVTLIPELDKGTTRKKNYRLISLTNRDVKILPKILGTEFNSTLKVLYTMTKWDLFLECKHGSIYKNQLMQCTTLTKWRKNTHMIISVDAEKAFDRIQHSFLIKKKPKHSTN